MLSHRDINVRVDGIEPSVAVENPSNALELSTILEEAFAFGKKVIFYDDRSGMLAARGVWLCLYFSHPDTSMLDGGFSLWSKKNYKTENSQNHFLPSSFSGKIDERIITGFEYIQNNLDSLKIIDVRTFEEYSGKVIRAARGGHIPSSDNIDLGEISIATLIGTIKRNPNSKYNIKRTNIDRWFDKLQLRDSLIKTKPPSL